MAAFMPPSRVVAMSRCSHRFASVLCGERERRIDGLFVMQPEGKWEGSDPDRILHFGDLGSPEFHVSIFGENEFDFTNGSSAGNHIMNTREAPKGYDGHGCNFQIIQLSFLANCQLRRSGAGFQSLTSLCKLAETLAEEAGKR
jgi:hypothetical protein